MATKSDKKSDKKKKRKPVTKRSPAKPIEDRHSVVRIIIGIVFVVFCLFTAAALISYAFTWTADQSLRGDPELWKNYVIAQNACGKIGFEWADFLIAKLFGLGAFIVPIFIGLVAIYCFRIRRVRIIRYFLICTFGCILFSVLFAFIAEFLPINEIFTNGAGGSYGNFANEWLCSMLGYIGAGGVLLALLFVWLTCLNRKVAEKFDNFIYNSFHSKKKEMDGDTDDIDGENEDSDEESDTQEEKAGLNREEIPENDNTKTESEEGEAKSDQDEDKNPGEDVIDLDDPDNPEDHDNVQLIVEKDGNDYLANLTEDEKARLYDPRLDLSSYKEPLLSLLEDYREKWYEVSRSELEKNKMKIVNSLGNYKIKVSSIFAKMGPTVTLYKIHLADGIRIAQVKRLEEDIAISLGAKGVRVVTLSDAIGIEVANEKPSIVALKSVLNSPQFKAKRDEMELPVAMGITVNNEPFFFDLAKMPHLLIAGATGMGKSVGLNALIASLLYCKHPSEMKFVMVDPKKVELDFYAKLERHFLAKMPDEEESIITDTQKVVYTLKSLCIEMDARYDLLKYAGVRKIKEYNEKFLQRKLNPLKGHKFLPYIVVVIDEFADLIITAGREIEEPIARLAQKARAVGIHLVIATQRPTTDVITGTIKSNFNSRIAFKVNSSVDSKTIIDQSGANRLIGRGDMLVTYPGIDLTRVQCALIDTQEVIRITDFIGGQKGYDHAFDLPEYEEEDNSAQTKDIDLRKRDDLFSEAAKIVVQYQQGSTSLIQRKLTVGYARAGRIIDQLETAGIVGPFEGSKARAVLISDFDSLDRILDSLNSQQQ